MKHDIPARVEFDPATGHLHLEVTDPESARYAWRVDQLTVDVELEGRHRTDTLERHWTVQEGPDGPVESLAPYSYLTAFLSGQASRNPTATARDLLLEWSIKHPQPTHDTDPRGPRAYSYGVSIPLDGDGIIQLVVEGHVAPDGTYRDSAQILRLPPRALSWREFRRLLAAMCSADDSHRAREAVGAQAVDTGNASTCACGAPAALAVGYRGEPGPEYQCIRCATADPRSPFFHRDLSPHGWWWEAARPADGQAGAEPANSTTEGAGESDDD